MPLLQLYLTPRQDNNFAILPDRALFQKSWPAAHGSTARLRGPDPTTAMGTICRGVHGKSQGS